MINPKDISNLDSLIKLAGHAEIVKHTPGEIHLKINATGIVLALGLDLLGLKASLRGILGTEVSGRTVVVKYDEKVLPKELWDLLIKSHGNPKIQQLVRTQLLSRLSTATVTAEKVA